jgi:Neprosin
LYFNGTSASNAIGSYPDTLFGDGGPLTGNASRITYGGETTGTVSFPPMGSGLFAHEGFRRAAYQRNIGYYPPGGGAIVNASLVPAQPTPSWYTAQVNTYDSPWLETLWFGGPGGDLPDAFVIVPEVRYKHRGEAYDAVEAAGLVPESSGSDAPCARVFTQMPLPGGRVPRGRTVHMVMRDVPPP